MTNLSAWLGSAGAGTDRAAMSCSCARASLRSAASASSSRVELS